jgi:alpha-N-arabinofuranosidase
MFANSKNNGIRSLFGLSGSFFILLFLSHLLSAQNKFTNPILPGGFPDPSICRDGDDYYLVNSTFEYFPGLPIHHSKDLVNWKLVGYGLHRQEQVTGAVNLVDVQTDGGIHAPSIRCHQGKFYIITTNVYQPPGENSKTQFVNFVITADDVRGPWSKPSVLEGAPGIDPDIFFDDDGRVWYVGTHSPEKPNFPGEGEIWLQEIDAKNWKLTGQRYFLWRGACGGTWAEGPHLYKKDGRYYLMVAEGGTSFNHAVMIAVSDKLTGPYVSNDRNPILTSRHLSYDFWVNSTGHGDLIELPDGRWYMVALGIRGDEQRRSNMGRETHLMPVSWEREPFWWKTPKYLWPVVSPKTGRVERQFPVPFNNTRQYRDLSFTDNFEVPELKLEWNFRRFPVPGTYSLTARPGFLRLFAKPAVIRERTRASLIGFRQTESDFSYSASMFYAPQKEGIEAGINLFQKDADFLSLTIEKQSGGENLLKLVRAIPEPNGKKLKDLQTLKRSKLSDYKGQIIFRVTSKDGKYLFDYSLDKGRSFQNFAQTRTDHILSKGYTGAYLGIYATANGKNSNEFADFDWVRYEGFER